ncbi:hypothetical protein JCM6882_001179, partial [Rhodosporidiobolus microsporus]
YLPSQGILPHTDGPAYLPCTTTLSLGSHTVLCLRSKPAHLSSPAPSPATTDSSPPSSSASTPDPAPSPSAPPPPPPSSDEVQKIDLFLPPRSLLVLTGELYADWLHGIQPLPADSSEVLRGCANWEGWWAWQAQNEASRASEEKQEEGEEGQSEGAGEREGQKEEVEKRRKLVEAGHGWKREKRVSLTCRRVAKVRKGLFKLG